MDLTGLDHLHVLRRGVVEQNRRVAATLDDDDFGVPCHCLLRSDVAVGVLLGHSGGRAHRVDPHAPPVAGVGPDDVGRTQVVHRASALLGNLLDTLGNLSHLLIPICNELLGTLVVAEEVADVEELLLQGVNSGPADEHHIDRDAQLGNLRVALLGADAAQGKVRFGGGDDLDVHVVE